MSLDGATLAAILLMATITYATRIAGLLLTDRLVLSGRARAAFERMGPGWRDTVLPRLARFVETLPD